MHDPGPLPMLRRIAPFAGGAIGVTGVVFVARTLLARWDEVAEAFGQARPWPLAGSLALGLGAMTLIGWIWTTLLRTRGHVHHRAQALSWYFTGQLGKYVPGGIWPIVGRAEMAARSGIPRSDAYASTGLSLVTTYLAAAVVVALGSLASGMYVLLGASGAGFLLAGWWIFSRPALRGRALRTLGRLGVSVQSLTDPGRLVRLTAAHLPAWVLMSLSTSVTAAAFGADISLIEMLFITSASWLVGFVVIGVPGGLGVREAVFTSLAGGIVGAPMAVSLALVSRVVFIAVDLGGAAGSNVVARATNRVTQRNAES